MTMDVARPNAPSDDDDDDEDKTLNEQHLLEEASIAPAPHICSKQGKIHSFLANVHGFPGQHPKVVPLVEKLNVSLPRQDATIEPTLPAIGQELSENDDTSDDEVIVVLENHKAQPIRNATELSDDDDDIEIVVRPPWASTPQVIDLTEDASEPFSSHCAKKANMNPYQRTQHQRQTLENDAKRRESRAARSTGGERRYVLQSGAPRKSTAAKNSQLDWQKNNFNATMSNEDADREQERLFQESAARVRCRAKFQVKQNASSMSSRMVTFPHPIIDVQNKFPDHWTFVDTYARLGLPKDAPLQLVKLHYRTLARAYHPDKSGTDSTARRFQAIAEAYNTIMNRD